MLVDNDIYKITRTDKVDFLQFKKLIYELKYHSILYKI